MTQTSLLVSLRPVRHQFPGPGFFDSSGRSNSFQSLLQTTIDLLKQAFESRTGLTA